VRWSDERGRWVEDVAVRQRAPHAVGRAQSNDSEYETTPEQRDLLLQRNVLYLASQGTGAGEISRLLGADPALVREIIEQHT
jgi:hypothetical protein